MSMKQTVMLVGLFWSALAIAQDAGYRIAKEKDSSFGNVRSRVTLEIEAVGATTDHERLESMMAAAVGHHRKTWPDAVSVRLWDSYEDDSSVRNRIIYAPDGCGWTGDVCGDRIWTDLLRGTVPPSWRAWGRLTDEEKEEGEELICRQDLQCWGEKHSLRAIFACQPLIEGLAKYDYEWTDGWLEPKLSRLRWDDRAKGTLSYTGDKLKFQNGFGAWVRIVYWCHFDPEARTARVQVNVAN